jgi:hypothetical protein
MLEKALKGGSMGGRSVDMKVIATGQIADAYDLYIHVGGYSDKVHTETGRNRAEFNLFVRLTYWKTTHKKLLMGSVSVLDVPDLPFTWSQAPLAPFIEQIEMIATPVEIKDYWKKSFEKYVVVAIGKMFKSPEGLECLDHIWRHSDTSGKVSEKPSYIKHVLAYTCPLASWEAMKRQTLADQGDEGEGLDHKCYEGPHGFVRSDNADDFTILPVSSFPVTELIV